MDLLQDHYDRDGNESDRIEQDTRKLAEEALAKRKAVQHERCRHKPHRASYGRELLSDAAGSPAVGLHNRKENTVSNTQPTLIAEEIMPTLTLEAIRENPWNVLTHDLPSDPTHLLLKTARLAATYCFNSENMFRSTARLGEYQPAWWDATDETPDAHEESENICRRVNDKLSEICDLLGEDVEEPAG
jgi:hypothetical protein